MRLVLKAAVLTLLLVLAFTPVPRVEEMSVKAVMRRGVECVEYSITVDVNYAHPLERLLSNAV